MDMSGKYSCAHSHVRATGYSDLNLHSCSRDRTYTVTKRNQAIANVRFQARSLISWLYQRSYLNLSLNQPKRKEKETTQRTARHAAPDHTCTEATLNEGIILSRECT